LLVATALDPRIKTEMFSVEQKGIVRAVLIDKLKSNAQKQSNSIISVESNDLAPPVKIPKLSIGGSRIQQILNASKQQQQPDGEDLSLLEAVNSFVFEIVIYLFRKWIPTCARASWNTMKTGRAFTTIGNRANSSCSKVPCSAAIIS
jgi:hypothetical protein